MKKSQIIIEQWNQQYKTCGALKYQPPASPNASRLIMRGAKVVYAQK